MSSMETTITKVGNVTSNLSFTIMHTYLMCRILPFSSINREYLPLDVCGYRIYIHKSMNGYFAGKPKAFIDCCENIEKDQIPLLKDNMFLVIDLHFQPLKHEMVMPAYSLITVKNHVFCFIATKFVIQCMKSNNDIHNLAESISML